MEPWKDRRQLEEDMLGSAHSQGSGLDCLGTQEVPQIISLHEAKKRK